MTYNNKLKGRDVRGGRGKLGEVEFLPKSTCNYGAQISIVVLIHSSVSALLPTGENNKLFQKWSIPPPLSPARKGRPEPEK